jgi:hypothetical protein
MPKSILLATKSVDPMDVKSPPRTLRGANDACGRLCHPQLVTLRCLSLDDAIAAS